MRKYRLSLLLIICFMMMGCSQQPVEQEVIEETVDNENQLEVLAEFIPELKLETLNLQNLEPYEVRYTPYESDCGIYTGVNNIDLRIEEYYNENTRTYSYVLTVEEKELEEDSEFVPYKIIKIQVGTLPDEENGIYTLSTTSPLYINLEYREAFEMNFYGQNYFLFSSSNRLFDEEFRVELLMVNQEPLDDYEPYSQTFRLINTSSRGNNSYTILTD